MKFDRFGRREFITFLSGAAATWALPARGQRMRRIGFLLSSAEVQGDVLAPLEIAAFLKTLHELGWTEGRDVEIAYRSSEGSSERLQSNARELVGIADVIVAVGGPALQHLLVETRTVPIVFTVVADPAASGFVDNFAHPGGNATGFSTVQDSAIAGKWLELLKEMVSPALSRVMVVMEADSAPQRVMRDTIAAAASHLGVMLVSAEVRDMSSYANAIEAFAHGSAGALIVLPNAITVRHAEEIHALAARYRLPAIYSYPIYAKTGGLMSYGPDPVKQFPEAARYVSRILRGERAGDLPVQAPTQFELVINLKTAKALGLTVPLALLARADEVIE